MLDWISQHSKVLSVFTNFGTLLIWLVYAQLLYLGFRRQRRPRLIINRGRQKDIDALCIISNMSAEAIFIEYIIAELKTSKGTIIMDVTDFEQEYSDDDEPADEEGNRERRTLAPVNVSDNTRQGPLESGGFLHIGTFDDLVKRLAREGGIEMNGHRPKDSDLQFKYLTIRLIGVYGSEDMPVGSERSFDLIDNEHYCSLAPTTWDTKRLASFRQRRKLRKMVADLNESNFTSSSSVRIKRESDASS
ncbi:hypothetical protein [Modicisalibacter luteus]|uniref:Uncharacterized protein n=1 Tax=Modicisalibacter luteus TaxID=453962 RepID=A0ABV7LW35_9GAMM|nr:hypothetical protein [Halomonas lutea]GHB06083.1 hypothetical protein GCM10007159_29910 [Halomonas lutea]